MPTKYLFPLIYVVIGAGRLEWEANITVTEGFTSQTKKGMQDSKEKEKTGTFDYWD